MKHIPRTILRGAIIVGVLCASIFTFVYAIDTPSFSVFNPTTSSIVAQWDAVPDASYYNVSTTASGEIIKTTDTHTAFTGLTPSTGYIFQIEAVDGSGTSSGFSAPTTTYTSPTIPSVSGFSNITTTSIQVNWGAITEAVYYTVSSTAGTVTTTNTTSTFTGLTPNTLHTFQVRAHDAYAQASAFSTAASTSTETLPQLAPPTISDFTNTTSSIQVFWDPITGASYYIISRSTSQTVTSNSSTVGVNTSADYILPWNRFYNYSASEMLYLKDEIATGAGPIDSVWFYKDSGNTTTTVNDVTVYLKHTSSTTLSSGVGSTAGYTQVYSGSFPNNVSSGWVGVSTTVFDYNGTDSLQMLIVKGSELFTPTRPYYRYTTTSAYRARYYYNDSSAFSSGVTSLTQTLNRPNTKFGLTITNLTGTIETVTTTDTNFIFSNLSPSTTYYFQVRTVDAISQSSVSSSVTSTFTETPPPPATPDISSFSNVTTTIGVTWGSVYGAIYYTVSSSAGTVTTTNTTYTFNNLPPNVQYTFQVKAHDAYNQSSSFSVASSTITVIPAPDTPEISSFVNTTTTIQVNWGAVSSTSYYTVSSTAGTVTTTQTNYTFTGLSPSTTYDFQMRATDEYSQNSDFSTVSSTITETPPVPDSPLFATVTKTTSSIALAWNSVLYAEYYTVSSTAGTVTTTQSNYTYNDLTPNTAYTFQVNAVDMFERSSNFSGATTTVTDSLDPPATPAFNSIYKTYSSIELYWNIVSGALFYTVSSTAGTVTTTLNTYTFINLSPSTTYYFQIKATNLYDQESAYSTVTSTLTGRAPIFASSTAAISTSTTFTYTGAAQTYTVGSGVTSVVIEVWGAKGGLNGGLGGYATGRLSVTPGQPLYVYVGQKGVTSTSGYTGRTFNGGGSANHSSGGRGSGGGASDVRAGSTATTSRVIVGGGGGGGYTAAGGAGGGLVGATGGTWATPGTGGSQGAGGTGAYCSAHGSLGLGGSIESGCANTVDGGGGGYYGGGAGAAGGGGSSYIGGVTSATTTAGVWGGNGQIIIHASSTAGSGGSLSAITSSTNQSGYVTLVTSIDDADDDPLMITYRYSAGACGAYSSALATTTLIGTPSSTYGQGSIVLNNSTSTGYQLSNITTASGANTVTTTWDSRSQLPLAENSIYCIYSVVSDGAATSTVVTTTVTINNLGRSVASSLAVTAQTNGSGHVTVKTVFDDVNDDVLSLTYRYKSGSCTAYTGTEATSTLFGTPSSTYGQGSIVLNNSTSTGYQLSNITTASGANTVTTTWDSKTQLPAANGTYCVYVIAYDGTSTSTAVSTTVTLDNVSPSQPSISSFSDTATTITVNWGAISGASYYTVSSTAGATVTTTLTNRTFSSLTPTTTYTFQIMVTDSYNNTSTYSTASSTRTDQIYTPTISSFSSITTSSITVNWSAISGASYYTVSSTAGATVTTTLTSRTFTGLDTYALYSFQMTATDVNGLSSTSSIVTSTRTGLPEQLGATTIADLTAGTSTIQIGWDAIGGASYYIISRSTLVGLDTGGSPTTFSYTGASTTYTVPEGVTSILIDAYGAGGGAGAGSNAGSGARMKGIVSTTPGEVLKILVGESPAGSNGGGGGTFVVRSPYTTTSTVLVAAGGGGGNGTGVSAGRHGQITTSGGTAGGAGGTNGAGGTAGTFYGGGGFLTNGGGVGGGGSFITGAVGGGNGGSGEGGFGGGGQGSGVNATGGGGGGYSGGGGGSSNSGGGGGSIINGTTLIATAGGGSAPGAHGQVFITDQLGLSGSITSVTTTEISYLISGLSPSTTYYFQVNPVDQYGQVGVSSTVSSTYTQTPPPPVTPTIVSSTNNTSSIQISWDAIYGVSYYTVSSTAGATVTTTQTSRTFTGLTPSTTYNFQVKADDAYNQSSSFSNVLATSTILTSIASAPTLSAFTNITSNTIRVNWSTVLWNSYYTVSSTAGTITTTATNYTFSGLTPSTTHNFQVKSTDMWGRDTAYSSVGTTSTPKPSAPSTPTISSLDESTLNTSSTVRVYWDLISGASYYTLYYSTTVTTTSSGGGPSIVGTAYTTPSTYYVPFDRYYNYTATEILYLASEISTGAGTISSTAFYKNSGDTGTTITPVTIYMKHSTSTTLPTGVASTAGYTQVYSGAITNSMTSGWATTTLSPTFSYNGTSNLQILIVRGNQPYVLGSAIPVHAVSSTPTYLTRRFRDDTVSWVSGTTLLDQSYERPVIRFNLAQISTTTALSGTITSVTTTQTSTIITGLSPSTTYYFQIKAMDAYNQSSASSTVTSTITPPSPSPSSTTITSFSRTTSTITVNWAAASGAGYYTVSSTAGAAVTTTQTSRTFTGLNPNTSYSFQVQPANSYGVTTTYSSVSSTLTLALSPSVTSFAWPTTSSIQVTWSAVTGTTYYTVSSTAGTVTTTQTSYTYTGLTPGTTYIFQAASNLTDYSSASSTYILLGTFLSSIEDIGYAATFGTVNWNDTLPAGATVTMEVRAGNQSDLSDGVWTFVSKGSALNTNFDGRRYYQYRAILFTSSTDNVPSVEDVSISYYGPSTGSFISSPYDSGSALNFFAGISWTATVPSSTTFKIQVRTSPDNADWTAWVGPDGTNGTYFTDGTGAEAIPAALADGANDRWIQYRAFFEGNGIITPTLSDISLTYTVNATPDIVISTSTVTQASDGTVTVPYNVRDLDTSTGATPGVVSIDLQYCTASCWIPGSETWVTAASSSLSGDFGAGIEVDASSSTTYTSYSLIWTPALSYNNQYNDTNFKIRLRANDGEAANNTGVDESNTFTLDTTDPVVTNFITDARTDAQDSLTITVTDDTMSGLEMKLSSVPDLGNDGTNAHSGEWIPYTATSSWTFLGSPAKVYYQIRDAYGNISSNGDIILIQTLYAPPHFVYQDVSNAESGDWREFLAWEVIPVPTNGFNNYTLYRSTDGETYSVLTTETDRTVNYYLDQSLDTNTTYYYKITVEDDEGNISNYSSIVMDTPDGQGGSDTTAPTISNVATPSIGTQSVTITWDTDELSNSYIDYIEVPGGDFSEAPSVGTISLADTEAGIGEHQVILTGLTPNTTYYYQVRSIDPSNNVGTSTPSPDGHSVTTLPGPSITGIGVSDISNTQVTVAWTTDEASDSYVYYSIDNTFTSSTVVGNADAVNDHSVTLPNLTAGTTYYYYVKSGVAEDKNVIDGEIMYHTFTTLNDQAPPVITFDEDTDVEVSDAAMIVSWTTNEPATTVLEYGTSTSYGTVISNNDLNTSHDFTISGLTIDTLYYVRFTSTDLNDNASNPIEFSTTTSDSTDYTPPVITSVTTTVVTDDQALITWTTNEGSTSQVYYGTSSTTLPDLYSTTNSNYDRTHAVVLSSLTISTEYYYYVMSVDLSGNITTSTPLQSFTTLETLSEESEVLLREQAAAAAAGTGSSGGGSSGSTRDATAPTIFNAQVGEVGGTSAKITWSTDEGADSVVEFGTTLSYGKAGVSLERTIVHEIVVSDLLPLTLYSYRISSADASGNRSEFTTGSFTTTLTDAPIQTTTSTEDGSVEPDVAEEMFLMSMQRATELIKSLSTQVSVEVLETSLLDQASIIQQLSDLLPRPVIGGQPVVDESANNAAISWTTDKESNSLIEFAPESVFAETGVYNQTIGDSIKFTNDHSVEIQGLQPATTYRYRVISRTPTGAESKSKDFSFTTKAQSIEIGSYKISVVSPEEAVFGWSTSLPTDSSISYAPYRNGVPSIEARQVVRDPSILTEHSMTLKGLEGGVTYDIELSGKDSAGNTVSKLIQGFLTDDTDASPVISQIKTDSSIIPGAKDRIQVIISWTTNELATSQVFYRSGFGSEGAEFEQNTILDLNYTKKHIVVVTNFEPGSVYQFVVESKDSSGNLGRSKTLTVLTPQKEESVFQVIMGNFEDLFGWVGKLRK